MRPETVPDAATTDNLVARGRRSISRSADPAVAHASIDREDPAAPHLSTYVSADAGRIPILKLIVGQALIDGYANRRAWLQGIREPYPNTAPEAPRRTDRLAI